MTNDVVEIHWQTLPLLLSLFWAIASIILEASNYKIVAPYLTLIDKIVFRSTAVFYILLFLYHAIVAIKIV